MVAADSVLEPVEAVLRMHVVDPCAEHRIPKAEAGDAIERVGQRLAILLASFEQAGEDGLYPAFARLVTDHVSGGRNRFRTICGFLTCEVGELLRHWLRDDGLPAGTREEAPRAFGESVQGLGKGVVFIVAEEELA